MLSKEMKGVLGEMSAKPILTVITILLLSILMPQPTYYQTAIMYSVVIIGFNTKQLRLKPLSTAKNIFLVCVLLALIWYLGKYLAVLIGLFVLFIITKIVLDIRKKEKSLYLTGLRDIEKRLFGRTLDKEKKK